MATPYYAVRAVRSVLAILPLFVASCGSSSSGGTSPASEGTDASSGSSAVASTPLRGVVGGQPFEGKTALGHYGEQSRAAEFYVYDGDRTCADLFSVRDGWSVTASTPWRAGVIGDVGALATIDGAPVGTSSTDLVSAGFRRITDGSNVHNDRAREGRVEVLEAPTSEGEKGRVRLRVVSTSGDRVEGEMPVEICTVYPDR